MMMGMGTDQIIVSSDPLAAFNAAQNSSNNDALVAGRDVNGNACEPGWDAGCLPVSHLPENYSGVTTLFDSLTPDHFLTPDPAGSGSKGGIVLIAIAGVIAFAMFAGGRR